MPHAVPRTSPYVQRLRPFAGTTYLDGPAARARQGTWRAHFAGRGPGGVQPGPLVLDVGCNDGVLLDAIAGQHPDTAFIGLDWSPRLLYHAAERLQHNPNVTLVHGRAQELTGLFAPGELDEVWLFQPEPMQLSTRHPTRLFDEPFLLDCARALKPGGLLTLKTDHPGYYQWAVALLGADPHPDLAAQLRGEVKAKRKEFADPATLPPPNPRVRERFAVTLNTAHYWADTAAQAHTASRPYSGQESTYERRFKSKRLPIYSLELQRR